MALQHCSTGLLMHCLEQCAPVHAQAIFGHLALGQNEAVNPRSFWRAFRDYDGSPINVREHQDAYEFFTRLQVNPEPLLLLLLLLLSVTLNVAAGADRHVECKLPVCGQRVITCSSPGLHHQTQTRPLGDQSKSFALVCQCCAAACPLQDLLDAHLRGAAGRTALQPVIGGRFAQQVHAFGKHHHSRGSPLPVQLLADAAPAAFCVTAVVISIQPGQRCDWLAQD